MNYFINNIIAALLLSAAAGPIFAAETNTYNRVTYQVTEQKEVRNDEIRVTMAVERDSQDATKLSDEMNRAIKAAIDTIHNYPSVKSSTSDYSIRPVYSRDKHLDHWHGVSSILLVSQNINDMAVLVQNLQKTLLIKSTRYNVSAERKDKIQTSMIETALKKFNTQAELISKNMGFKKYRLVNLNINNSGRPPRPVYAASRLSATSADVAAPAFESGTT
ncbi:MAG: SIMPL domain-containing protein, partial [Gammaproteobacteria bacterium]|nr:SIMPL domain-containing protein [Gammaproteobacteria bacterium]